MELSTASVLLFNSSVEGMASLIFFSLKNSLVRYNRFETVSSEVRNAFAISAVLKPQSVFKISVI